MIELSDKTKNLIMKLFPREQIDEVEMLLETQCGDNLPMVESMNIQLAERIRFAVLRLSQGRLHEVEKYINHAKADWRDTLTIAGFADDVGSHRKWNP